MYYKEFDRGKLNFRKLSERCSKLSIEKCHVPLIFQPKKLNDEAKGLIREAAGRIREARKNGKPVIMAFGAHVIKNGLATLLIELIKKGLITHLAGNGAVSIHDWEFAFIGETSEDVRENVRMGQFGIWEETGRYINLALLTGAYHGYGYGESVGKMISGEGLAIPDPEALEAEAVGMISSDRHKAAAAIDLLEILRKEDIPPGFLYIPHKWKNFSVQGATFEMNIPLTIHPMFGHDIIYTHPLNNGAAVGRTALTDFLRFTESVRNIDGGVYLSVGSAVMSPMIFEKALSMAQNIEMQQNRHIDNHYIVVVDLAESLWDWQGDGEPPASDPAYYMRYNKTFSRMGGEMRYITVDNRDFMAELLHSL